MYILQHIHTDSVFLQHIHIHIRYTYTQTACPYSTCTQPTWSAYPLPDGTRATPARISSADRQACQHGLRAGIPEHSKMSWSRSVVVSVPQ